MNWYLMVLKKYADFSGRARRKEYWFFVLFNTLIYLGLVFLDSLIFSSMSNERGIAPLSTIYNLATLIPGLAVSVRRLHDTGRSGWMLLLGLIPCVGAIILLVFSIEDSQMGDNEYGENPKESETFSTKDWN